MRRSITAGNATLALAIAFSASISRADQAPPANAAPAPPQSAIVKPAPMVVTPILPPANPSIDMNGFLKVSQEAAALRLRHRVSEDDFIRMSRMPGTLILDARSHDKYDLLHVKGAVNLSFPDIAVASLARTIPDKSTRILIYCNNNFLNAPNAFPSKLATASLNLSTFIALYNYGYRNVYELGPTLDVHQTRIQFEPPIAPR
ncbi:MAG TPA: rhodanese-like domain-containing protein [Candidatus Sulfotelmatobacter sp.]|nr:rhodanese-like domain-containing protein [Candidatus Sulfotelmatobacter sp.]